MITALAIGIPVIAVILWVSGIIPGAIREYREFKDEMEESRDPFRERRD